MLTENLAIHIYWRSHLFDYCLVVSVWLTPFGFSSYLLLKEKLGSGAWVSPAETMSLEDSSLFRMKCIGQ